MARKTLYFAARIIRPAHFSKYRTMGSDVMDFCRYDFKVMQWDGDLNTATSRHLVSELQIGFRPYRMVDSQASVEDVELMQKYHRRHLPSNVPVGVLEAFARISLGIVALHGELFPTWVGDFHVSGRVLSGSSQDKVALLHEFVVAEAPGLDCGRWEEDGQPQLG